MTTIPKTLLKLADHEVALWRSALTAAIAAGSPLHKKNSYRGEGWNECLPNRGLSCLEIADAAVWQERERRVVPATCDGGYTYPSHF